MSLPLSAANRWLRMGCKFVSPSVGFSFILEALYIVSESDRGLIDNQVGFMLNGRYSITICDQGDHYNKSGLFIEAFRGGGGDNCWPKE